MPKAKSAEKQARASERRRIRNQAVKNKIRSGLKLFQQLSKSDSTKAREQARQIMSWMDRAVKNRVIHFNVARRQKSRLMIKLNALAK